MSSHAPGASSDILFEMPATSSPDASISTLETASLNLANDTSNANNPDLNDHSKELDGMRTVNITPTEKNSVHGIDERHSVSPPLVLKSVPTTPLTGKFQQEAEGPTTLSHATLSELDSSRETPMDDEDDPRELVISSLRVQISDLFSQVTLLNSKLVQSYDRVSHLEETLDENTEKLQALEGERLNLENEKVVLEIERNKYEGMLKDGSLVERATIAAELNRLMQESMESSNARKSAEEKHARIESELSDLSANLFSTANEMVSKERQARSTVELSLSSSQTECMRLQNEIKALEARLAENSRTVEILQEERAVRDGEMKELKQVVQSVDMANISPASGSVGVMRMMNSHAPYKVEYLGFIAHLRKLLPTTLSPPPISSVLSLPFLQRLAVEDSEPTLRLDLAPSLNWLTRRSVLASIHSNTLHIEQLHVATLFLESSAATYSYSPFGSANSLPTSPTQLTKVVCALCGKVVYMSPEAIQVERQQHQSILQSPTTPTPTTSQIPQVSSPQRSNSGGGWAAAKFLKSVNLPSLGGNGSGPSTPNVRHSTDGLPTNGILEGISLDRPPSPPPPTSLQTVIHAFRVPIQGRSNTLPASTSTDDIAAEYGPPYPLCHTGWCLARLRTTCELWGYVGHNVMGRVWREARSVDLSEKMDTSREYSQSADSSAFEATSSIAKGATLPQLPAKKKLPNLWGMGREVLDKLGGSPVNASDRGPSVTPAGLFNGVRRSLSVPTSNVSSSEKVKNESFEENDSSKELPAIPSKIDSSTTATELPLTAPGSTNQPPPPPKRHTSRLSAVYTGGDSEEAEREESSTTNSFNPATPNERAAATNSSPITLAGESSSAGIFVTPTETPETGMSPTLEQEISPNESKAKTTDAAIANAVNQTTGIELSTPTPATTCFSGIHDTESMGKASAHQRSSSIASTASDTRGVSTPRSSMPRRASGVDVGSRPSTPTKIPVSSRPSTPNDAITSSRPATPNKSSSTVLVLSLERPVTPVRGVGAPPPVPRRAAARNAARGSVGGKKEMEEKKTVTEKQHTSTMEGVKGTETKLENAHTVANKSTAKPATSSTGKEILSVRPGANAAKQSSTSVANTDAASYPPSTTEGPDTMLLETTEKKTLAPKSITISLPSPEAPSSSQHPLLELASSFIAADPAGGGRPRQPSVSASSVYSPSVYTTNSNTNPATGPEGDEKGREEGHDVQFYVGRTSWEERAWLELVRIRERMFWARLGGVRH